MSNPLQEWFLSDSFFTFWAIMNGIFCILEEIWDKEEWNL